MIYRMPPLRYRPKWGRVGLVILMLTAVAYAVVYGLGR